MAVAASQFQASVFRSMRAATLLDLILENDRDFDGFFGGNDEVLLAYAAGDFDFYDERIRADQMTVANLTNAFFSWLYGDGPHGGPVSLYAGQGALLRVGIVGRDEF